jgi:hypothetical protein
MTVTSAQVQAKAKAFVDALCKLPRSQYAATPSGHYGRDYNTLRKLALEALPGIDQRLIGKYVSIRSGPGGPEVCEASFVEIETYARQLLEQVAAAPGQPTAQPARPDPSEKCAAVREKAYDVEAIRREHNQAYAPWSEQDDAYLRSRFLEGATIDELVWEFGRQPGGIRSRLRKLGLDPRDGGGRPVAPPRVTPLRAETTSADPGRREQRPRAGRVWTSEEDERLLREFEAGSPLEAIARLLRRGVFSVEVRLCKLGRTPRSSSPA